MLEVLDDAVDGCIAVQHHGVGFLELFLKGLVLFLGEQALGQDQGAEALY
jgi:hypothetical protein